MRTTIEKKAKAMRNFFRKLATSMQGTAAIEFAFIVPVLTVIVVTLADVANIATGVGEMETAARAAVQYAMNGGTDMTVAQTQGLNAWDNEPSDAALSAVASCSCSGVAADCEIPCSDNTVPDEFVTVTASGTMGGSVIKRTENFTQKVRVR
jgi:Flp pilus assembly protein TadG